VADTEKLIDKIRKLLAIAADTPYEAEAATALGMAQRLMLEHGLSQEQIDCADTDRKWTRERVWAGKRRSSADDHALIIVQEFFFVRPLLGVVKRSGRVSRPQFIDFIGTPEHVAIARYVYAFLCRVFQDLWKLRVKVRHRQRAWDWMPHEDSADYYLGLRLGFCGKLRTQRKEMEGRSGTGVNELIRVGSALTRLETALDEELNRQSSGRSFRITTNRREPELDTLLAGMGDGAKINMRTPLSAAASHSQLLTR